MPASVSSNLVNASIQTGRNISYFVATQTPNDLDQPVLNWLHDLYLISSDSSSRFDVPTNGRGLNTLIIKDSSTLDSGLYSIEGGNYANTISSPSSQLRVIDEG